MKAVLLKSVVFSSGANSSFGHYGVPQRLVPIRDFVLLVFAMGRSESVRRSEDRLWWNGFNAFR